VIALKAKATWQINPEPAVENYDYSSLNFSVINNATGQFLPPSVGIITGANMQGPHSIGSLVDGRILLPSTPYTFKIRGRIKSKHVITGYTFSFSDWVEYSFETLSDTPKSHTLIFESNVPDGAGVNFFSMPFPEPWYAYDVNDQPLLIDGVSNQIQNALHLRNAINLVAGVDSNVVSTFGRWDNVNQEDIGVLVLDPPPASDLLDFQAALVALSEIQLQQGEGYQVYMKDLSNYGNKVEVVIKNTLPGVI